MQIGGVIPLLHPLAFRVQASVFVTLFVALATVTLYFVRQALLAT